MEHRQVQSRPHLDRPGKVQGRKRDPLRPEMRHLHADEAFERELHVFPAGRMPHELPGVNPGAEIQFPPKVAEPALRQIQRLPVQRDPRMQPIHRIHHETQRFNDPFVMGRNRALLEQSVKITAQQRIPAIPFFRITSDPHIFIPQRKNRLADPVPPRIKTFLHDLPGVDLQIFVRDFRHAPPSPPVFSAYLAICPSWPTRPLPIQLNGTFAAAQCPGVRSLCAIVRSWNPGGLSCLPSHPLLYRIIPFVQGEGRGKRETGLVR